MYNRYQLCRTLQNNGVVLMTASYTIRPLLATDIAQLVNINPTFQSDTILRVERWGEGYQVGWRLVETPLATPYHKGSGYDFDATEQTNIAERLAKPVSFLEVAIAQATGHIVGLLDMEEQDWNNTAFIWNLMMDVSARGQGLGSTFIKRAIAWSKARGHRAIMLETQTNNVPACRFYAKMGFKLVGVNEVFYSNRDIARDEVAIFWSYEL